MKILYLADQDLDNESGVSQKVSMQSIQWIKGGHEVKILSLQSLSFFDVNKRKISSSKIHIPRKGFKLFLHLIYSSWKLKKILNDQDFDLIYMRYRLYSPFLKNALKDACQVVELNSDDANEYRHSSFLLYGYNKLFRSMFLKKADGFVSVSNELKEKFLSYEKPISVIANGISCNALDYEDTSDTLRPSLVFIGSVNQIWHGIDKVSYMAEKLPEFDFHIVGTDGNNKKNLFYHGYLSTKEANTFVQKQDIGISTLSLYANNMNEASPLKTRQYLAQGLPIIYAYEDTDFDEENVFSLKLGNYEKNIEDSIDKIKSFVNLVYKNNSVREAARCFAKENLDVEGKEKKRLDFFGKFL